MSKKNDNDSDSLSAFTDSASQAQMSQSSSSNSITNQQASNSTPSAVKPASSVQSTPNPMASFNAVNISNVFKQIYNMKYLQRSSAIQSPANAGNQSPAATLDSPTTLNTGSDLRQFWLPDDQVKECYECNEKFTTFRRRHVSFGLFDFVEHIVLWKIKYFLFKKKALSSLWTNILQQVLGSRSAQSNWWAFICNSNFVADILKIISLN